jgi:hypothetical protein
MEEKGRSYVLAVTSSKGVYHEGYQKRVGKGTKGERFYDWACMALPESGMYTPTRIGAQPQRDVGGLHRRPHHPHQFVVQRIEVGLIPQLDGEGTPQNLTPNIYVVGI